MDPETDYYEIESDYLDDIQQDLEYHDEPDQDEDKVCYEEIYEDVDTLGEMLEGEVDCDYGS